MEQMKPYILIVEDDFAIREILTQVLEEHGYDVQGAANGQEALVFLQRHAPPQLILLDLMMPVMDGYAFRTAQQADAALASIPVVVLSADKESEIDPALEADGQLEKPVRLATLVEVVERFCGPPA